MKFPQNTKPSKAFDLVQQGLVFHHKNQLIEAKNH